MSRNYLADGYKYDKVKKGANSHATPRPEKQTVMNELRKIDTDQFLVPPVSAYKLNLEGDIGKGGNKKSESTNSSFRGR